MRTPSPTAAAILIAFCSISGVFPIDGEDLELSATTSVPSLGPWKLGMESAPEDLQNRSSDIYRSFDDGIVPFTDGAEGLALSRRVPDTPAYLEQSTQSETANPQFTETPYVILHPWGLHVHRAVGSSPPHLGTKVAVQEEPPSWSHAVYPPENIHGMSYLLEHQAANTPVNDKIPRAHHQWSVDFLHFAGNPDEFTENAASRAIARPRQYSPLEHYPPPVNSTRQRHLLDHMQNVFKQRGNTGGHWLEYLLKRPVDDLIGVNHNIDKVSFKRNEMLPNPPFESQQVTSQFGTNGENPPSRSLVIPSFESQQANPEFRSQQANPTFGSPQASPVLRAQQANPVLGSMQVIPPFEQQTNQQVQSQRDLGKKPLSSHHVAINHLPSHRSANTKNIPSFADTNIRSLESPVYTETHSSHNSFEDGKSIEEFGPSFHTYEYNNNPGELDDYSGADVS